MSVRVSVSVIEYCLKTDFSQIKFQKYPENNPPNLFTEKLQRIPGTK